MTSDADWQVRLRSLVGNAKVPKAISDDVVAALAAIRAQAEEVAALRALLRECQDAIDWCAQECGHRAAHELATRIDAHLAAR